MLRQPIADQGLIRKLNTAVILDTLRRFAPLSRAELSARTGLNRSTVSIIVNSLIEGNFVQETDLQSDRIGRPGMLLMLNPRGGFAVGVEIGVDFISVLSADFTAQLLWKKRVASDPAEGRETVLERAAWLVSEALELGHTHNLRPLGIGLGLPGLVDCDQGRLVYAPNLGWEDIPFRTLWGRRFSLPVFVENEANAAALGEYYFGAARSIKNFIYLSTGMGLGSGILFDGKLFQGSAGYAGEVGHIRVNPQGERCGCGQHGCWETEVSVWAILRRVQAEVRAGKPSEALQLAGGDLERIGLTEVVAAAHLGDSVATTALQETGRYLGVGIANLVNIFNPELVVVGGSLTQASDFILPIVDATARENALPPVVKSLRIISSAHGAEACVMGAVALVLDDILREPVIGFSI